MLGYVIKMVKHLTLWPFVKRQNCDRNLAEYYRIEYNYIDEAKLADRKHRLGIQERLGKRWYEENYRR
tara:strand:- start:191 stop:394 length:204 start_codon:yes stop_codon:yes gene_type:complete